MPPLPSLLAPVHQTDPVREAGPRLSDRGLGAGGPDRGAERQQEEVRERGEAGPDSGQSAVPDDADTEAAGRRLRRPQPQVA